MGYNITTKPNTDGATGTWPYGKIRDNSGIGDGTPVNTLVYNDFHQFFARMAALGFVTLNDLPENNANGFQFMTALQNNVNNFKGILLITTNTTLTDSDLGKFIICANGSPITLTLPKSSNLTNTGAKAQIYNVNTSTVTLATQGGDVFLPGLVQILNQYDSIELASNGGTAYYIINYNRKAKPITQTATSASLTGATLHDIYSFTSPAYIRSYKITFFTNLSWAVVNNTLDGATIYLVNATTSTVIYSAPISLSINSAGGGAISQGFSLSYVFIDLPANTNIKIQGQQLGASSITTSGVAIVEEI